MSPTAYIPVPISEIPNDNNYYTMLFDGGMTSANMYMAFDGKWPNEVYRRKYTHWLRPVDLSRMLEDCWKACEKRAKYLENRQRSLLNVVSNEVPDKEKYLQSVLNPPK